MGGALNKCTCGKELSEDSIQCRLIEDSIGGFQVQIKGPGDSWIASSPGKLKLVQALGFVSDNAGTQYDIHLHWDFIESEDALPRTIHVTDILRDPEQKKLPQMQLS